MLVGSLFTWPHVDRSIDCHGLLIQSSAAIICSADTCCSCSSTDWPLFQSSVFLLFFLLIYYLLWLSLNSCKLNHCLDRVASFQSTLRSPSCLFPYATLQAWLPASWFPYRSTTNWSFMAPLLVFVDLSTGSVTIVDLLLCSNVVSLYCRSYRGTLLSLHWYLPVYCQAYWLYLLLRLSQL
jgi:hypothetical protein